MRKIKRVILVSISVWMCWLIWFRNIHSLAFKHKKNYLHVRVTSTNFHTPVVTEKNFSLKIMLQLQNLFCRKRTQQGRTLFPTGRRYIDRRYLSIISILLWYNTNNSWICKTHVTMSIKKSGRTNSCTHTPFFFVFLLREDGLKLITENLDFTVFTLRCDKGVSDNKIA